MASKPSLVRKVSNLPMLLGLAVVALIVGLLLLAPLIAVLGGAFASGLGPLALILLSILITRRVSRVQTGVREDGKALYSRIRALDVLRFSWQRHARGYAIGRHAYVTAVASVPFVLIPWQGFLGEFGSMIRTTGTSIGLLAGAIVIACAVAVGKQFKRHVRSTLAKRREFEAALRFISGVTDSAWASASWDVDSGAEVVTIYSPPEAVAGAARNRDRIAQVLPGWTLDGERSGSTAVLRRETEAEAFRRNVTESSGGLVVGMSERGDGRIDLELAPGTSPARAEQVDAWLQTLNGLSLIEWAPAYNRAVAGRLTEEDRAMRSRIAGLLGVHTHEVTVSVTRDDEGIVSLTLRAPAGKAADGETRVAQMRRVMLQAVPGAHADWHVAVDQISDEVTMERRAQQSLPARVALDELLPAQYAPDEWSTLPVGTDPQGRAVGQDLLSAPMAAVAGPTGSGKTVLLVADATQRLTRGHDLIVIDPSKGGVDFASLEPWTLAFAREFDEAVVAIQTVYAEGRRRREVLLREGAVKWSDLSADVRAAEGIRPVTVLIDEAASLLIAPQVPKGLPKDHPEVLAAQELGGQKALLSLFIGKIARELRYVGVHLVLAMQRPDASILGGEVRSNLSHRVQLVAPGKPIGRVELEMLFPAPIVGAAYDAISRFDDGTSRGLAVLAGDEGDVAAIRVAYAPMGEIPALLEARGVEPVPVSRKYDLHPVTDADDPDGVPAGEDSLGDLFA